MKTWQDKANSIIFAECQREYFKVNRLPNGRMRKRHVPYRLSELAQELYDCVKNNLEEQAKAIFLRLNLPKLAT